MSLEQTDIDTWSADWQSTDAEPEVSFASIRRGFRGYTRSAVGGWLVGLTMVVVTTLMAWLDPDPTLIAAAVAVWAFVAAAVVFDLRYRRGTWRLAGESSHDYVELARRRLLARLRGIRFGWGLLAGETLFFFVWIPWVASADAATRGDVLVRGFSLLTVLVLAFSIGLAVMRRRAERELRGLERVRESMASLDLTA